MSKIEEKDKSEIKERKKENRKKGLNWRIKNSRSYICREA